LTKSSIILVKKIENRQTSGQVNQKLVQDAMTNEGLGVSKELANQSQKEAKSVIDLSKSTKLRTLVN